MSPATLGFGNVLAGSTSTSQTLTVNNTSASSLGITIAASGDYSETPSGATPCGANLNGGASCAVSVTFSPAATGIINGSVSVSYAGTNSPQLATLKGIGVGQVTTSLASLTFAGQTVGTTSASSAVVLTNNTNATVAISSITPSGNYAVRTGAPTDCGSSLAAGETCKIRVVFSPTHSGYLPGSIVVSDGGTNSPQIVNLSGTGLGTPGFFYAAGGGETMIFTIAPANGQLTPTYAWVAGPPAAGVMTLDPTGRFLFESSGTAAGLYAYTVNALTGALAPVTRSPFAAGSPVGVAVDPSGRFLYVGDSRSSSLYAFAIHFKSGALTPISGSPFTVGSSPQGIAADPSGRFLYVVASNAVWAFTINSVTGALTTIEGSPFAAGNGASIPAVDPTGRLIYVVNGEDNSVSAFTINSASGALAAVRGSPFATGSDPNVPISDLTGRFLYVSNYSSRSISAYTINSLTGALTPITGSPFAGGDSDMSVDPSNSFLYHADFLGDGIWAFDINQSTGGLTEFQDLDLVIEFPDAIVAAGFVP